MRTTVILTACLVTLYGGIAKAEPDYPSPSMQCRAEPEQAVNTAALMAPIAGNPISMAAVFQAIAQARAQPADPIVFGSGPKFAGTLWLSLDDPDAVEVTKDAVQTGGKISLRLIGFSGQSPAKSALLHMLLEHKEFDTSNLPLIVSHFQSQDIFSLLDEYDSLPKCSRIAANLRVSEDSNLASRKFGRLDHSYLIRSE